MQATAAMQVVVSLAAMADLASRRMQVYEEAEDAGVSPPVAAAGNGGAGEIIDEKLSRKRSFDEAATTSLCADT
jgi:hypothetical protein